MKRNAAKMIESMLKDMDSLKGWFPVLKGANNLLSKGYGPAHNTDEIFNAIPGKIIDGAYYAIIVNAEGKPVDWYADKSGDPKFLSGFGGWYKYSYDKLIENSPWIKRVCK